MDKIQVVMAPQKTKELTNIEEPPISRPVPESKAMRRILEYVESNSDEHFSVDAGQRQGESFSTLSSNATLLDVEAVTPQDYSIERRRWTSVLIAALTMLVACLIVLHFGAAGVKFVFVPTSNGITNLPNLQNWIVGSIVAGLGLFIWLLQIPLPGIRALIGRARSRIRSNRQTGDRNESHGRQRQGCPEQEILPRELQKELPFSNGNFNQLPGTTLEAPDTEAYSIINLQARISILMEKQRDNATASVEQSNRLIDTSNTTLRRVLVGTLLLAILLSLIMPLTGWLFSSY